MFAQLPKVAPLALAAALAVASPAAAAPTLGQPAPAFKAADAEGKTRSLSEFAGKTVVLEWTNEGCPYVQKHYKSGVMQAVQKQATKEGVVWLTVISSAPGQQGHKTAPQAKAWKASSSVGSSAVLLDPSGAVGKAYDARVTPHMYVIDRTGKLVYMGGIDDRPSADPSTLKGATNYVVAALDDLKTGRAVARPATRPYGCSVKYAG